MSYILEKIESVPKSVLSFFALTFASLLMVILVGIKPGIDFAGGVVVNFSCAGISSRVSFDDASERLANRLGTGKFILQSIGDDFCSVRFGANSGLEGNTKLIKDSIASTFDNAQFRSIDSIGPQVSSGLIRQSIAAICFSFLAIVFYLLLQFNYSFAISAVIVLICDVIIAAGAAALFGFELNLTLIAAFLTLIGYCVNDTVVLYDRIRSNLLYIPKSVTEVVSTSVAEVFRRSIVTSVVTILAVVGILFFADKAIQDFANTIIIGIVCGTFGSIYVASYLPLLFGLKKPILSNGKSKDKMFYAS